MQTRTLTVQLCRVRPANIKLTTSIYSRKIEPTNRVLHDFGIKGTVPAEMSCFQDYGQELDLLMQF